MNTPDYDNLKREFSSSPFKRMLASALGTSCFNCGSSKSVEYHHIVSLKLGGTNKFSNIVPLCHKCHKAAQPAEPIRNAAMTEEERERDAIWWREYRKKLLRVV